MEDRGSKMEDGRASASRVLARVSAVVRRVIGAPDYAVYLKHQRVKHPECTPLTEAEFLDEQLTARYSTPGGKCC